MAKTGRLKILYGESEPEAQASTAAAFEKAGHSVEKVIGRKAVEAALHKGTFDLWCGAYTFQKRPSPPALYGKEGAAGNQRFGHARRW